MIFLKTATEAEEDESFYVFCLFSVHPCCLFSKLMPCLIIDFETWRKGFQTGDYNLHNMFTHHMDHVSIYYHIWWKDELKTKK